MRVRLTKAARSDIKVAAEWYEEHREGLGLEFTDRVLEAIDRIAEHPLAHRKVIDDARRCNLDQFPYGLWYTIKENSIVIACLHQRRSPSVAKSRIPKGPAP